MEKLKTASWAVLIILLYVGFKAGTTALINNNNKEKSVYQYSKQEYIDKATENCSKDGTAKSYCRCFYTKYLENHSVEETLKFDTEASADENFVPTQEQKQLVAECV